jgi:hypothetical protein
MRNTFDRLVIVAIGLLSAAVATAQPEGNTPPTITNIAWQISRYNGPAAFPPYAPLQAFDPATELARELDILIPTITAEDPDFAAEGDDQVFFIAYSAWLPVAGYPSPEPPLMQGNLPVFFPPEGDGFSPPPPPPAIITVDITPFQPFIIPEFLGRNQARLQGLIDYDVSWRFVFAVSNAQDPQCNVTEFGLVGCQEPVSQQFVIVRAIENPVIPTPNPPPFADAGPDQTAEVGNTLVLDGSGTFDGYNVGFGVGTGVLDLDTLTFVWEWVSGPERVDPLVRDPVRAPQIAEVTLNQIGVYTYRLSVNDNINPQTSTDTVTLTVVSTIPENRPPTASISGPAGNIVIGSLIRLDGTGSTDPDGDPLTFRWVQTDELGNALGTGDTRLFQPLSGLQSPISTWQAVKTGTFFFRLLVSDGDLTATAQTSLTIVATGTAGATFISGADLADREDSVEDRATPLGACGGSLLPLLVLPLLLRLVRRAH